MSALSLPLIKPKSVTLQDIDGDDRKYILSRFPAVEGREIVTQYPMANLLSTFPQGGGYRLSEQLMFKLMCYVAVDINGQSQRLETRELIFNHVGDWELLGRLEWEMMFYNCSFFQKGTLLTFFKEGVQKWTGKIVEMLTKSSPQ